MEENRVIFPPTSYHLFTPSLNDLPCHPSSSLQPPSSLLHRSFRDDSVHQGLVSVAAYFLRPSLSLLFPRANRAYLPLPPGRLP